MKKVHFLSIALRVMLLLAVTLSITGCKKGSDVLNEQIEEMAGPRKTEATAEPAAEHQNEEALDNSEAVEAEDMIETEETDVNLSEKAVENPIFVKGFSPAGQNCTIYDFYYLDLDTEQMKKFFSFECKDVHFHEDIENRIKVRDFTGNLKTYDAIIRSDMLFNEDMTAVAVKWQEPDLSSHVGWCDADGNVTDVTAMIYNQNSDFDKLPQNQYPLFGPDNSLWFYDYNMESYRKYNIDTGKVEDPAEPISIAYTDFLEVVYGEDTIRYNNMGSGSLHYSRNSIQKYNYVNEHDQYTDLIPNTDWSIQNVAYSGGKIVFDAVRGNEYKVFLIENMNGVSEPRAIYSEQASGTGANPLLLFWRDPELRSKGVAWTQKADEPEQVIEDDQLKGKEAFFNCGKIYVDSDKLLHIDEKFFGMTYDELGQELNMSIPEPTDFPDWNMELQSCDINVGGENIRLIFQDYKLAVVDYEYRGRFDEEQWKTLCDKTEINGYRDTFDETKDRGYLDPGSGISYYYINYDYERYGRGDIMVEKYYWTKMNWD